MVRTEGWEEEESVVLYEDEWCIHGATERSDPPRYLPKLDLIGGGPLEATVRANAMSVIIWIVGGRRMDERNSTPSGFHR